MKFRKSKFGAIGKSRRLSVVHTRRGFAMMALIPWRRINRSMRPRLAPRPSSPQLGVDARAAIASVGFAMDLLDVADEIAIGG